MYTVSSCAVRLGWDLVLHNRALGVEGEDILQAYTEYPMGQDKLDLIP
jgi:hypothetical protein